MEILARLDAFLVARFGELGPLYAVGLLGVVLILVTLPVLLAKRDDPWKRLGRDKREADAGADPARPSLRQSGGAVEKLDKYSTFLEPQDEEELSSARLRMLRAGYRSPGAVRTFHFAQLALGLGFLAAGVLYAMLLSSTGAAGPTKLILSILIPGAAGYYLPQYWVKRRIQSRQTEIVEGFPDSLDMMLVCVEAGQSLDQAIIRVAREIRAGYPALADEYELVAQEIKAGKEKTVVLKDMSERAGVQDVSAFVTVLVQSTSFGTSIAEALRVYAAEMRDKRVMRAEEKANVLPTKLTLGTMMFTVPPLMLILIGPSIYGIIEAFENF